MTSKDIIILLLAVGGVIWYILEYRRRKSCSCMTMGRIIDVYHAKGTFVRYEYRVHGHTYTGSAKIGGFEVAFSMPDTVREKALGRMIPVHYNPLHPEKQWGDAKLFSLSDSSSTDR